MALAIFNVELAHGRAGEVVEITGQDFSAANNGVTIGGGTAAISVQSTTSITVTVPTLFGFGTYVELVVTNNDNGDSKTFHWWSKLPTATIAAQRAPVAVPGPNERIDVERPTHYEAKDWNRLAQLTEWQVSDYTQEGDVLAGVTGGLQIRAPGTEGFILADISVPGKDRVDWWLGIDEPLYWGGSLAAAAGSFDLQANSDADEDATNDDIEHFAVDDGNVSKLWIRNGPSASDTIDLIQIMVNGIVEYTTGTLGAPVGGNAGRTFEPNTTVVRGDELRVKVRKVGAVNTIPVLVGILVRT